MGNKLRTLSFALFFCCIGYGASFFVNAGHNKVHRNRREKLTFWLAGSVFTGPNWSGLDERGNVVKLSDPPDVIDADDPDNHADDPISEFGVRIPIPDSCMSMPTASDLCGWNRDQYMEGYVFGWRRTMAQVRLYKHKTENLIAYEYFKNFEDIPRRTFDYLAGYIDGAQCAYCDFDAICLKVLRGEALH